MMNGFKVTTKVLFRNENNEILMLKKENNPPINWDLPGGTLETDEQINNCIIRELNEELGVNIKFEDLRLFNVYVVNRTEKLSLLVIVYECDNIITDVQLSSEHSEYFYANEEKISKLKEESVIFDIIEDFYEKIK